MFNYHGFFSVWSQYKYFYLINRKYRNVERSGNILVLDSDCINFFLVIFFSFAIYSLLLYLCYQMRVITIHALCIGCISAVYRLDFLESFICLFEWEKRSFECMWVSIFIMLMGIFNMNIIYFSHLVHILLMFCKVNQFSHFTSNKYIIFITKLWFSLRNLIKIKNKIFYHKCSVMYIFDKNVYTFLENHPRKFQFRVLTYIQFCLTLLNWWVFLPIHILQYILPPFKFTLL